MLDIIILFLFQNIFLVTLLFWVLNFVGVRFFKSKNYSDSTEFFECGFLNTSKFIVKLNTNVFLVCLLLILYDVEFLFLVPFLYNMSYMNFITAMIFSIFIGLIIISFIYDWEVASLNWQI